MKDLEQLREIAQEGLAGLEAGPALRHRILEQTKTRAGRRPAQRWIAVAVSFALVLAISVPIAVENLRISRAPDPLGQVGALGDEKTGNERASLEPGATVLTITRDNARRAQGILGSGILRVNGRYYRELKGVTVSGSALGGSMGAVQEQTANVTLSSAAIVSSGVSAGTDVYGVSGMSGTLVACRMGGEILTFQRVSHDGVARVGSESGLGDVLQLRSHVSAMSLSGVGMVEGAEAERLFGILVSTADYEGAGSLSSAKQTLIIALDNGAAVQLSVSGDRLGGCGIWSSPDFFESFPR